MRRRPLARRVDAGRAFTASRRVRWGDVDPRGRLRLDATARYLQDVSNDDTRDAGLDLRSAWVVRRTVIDVVRAPAVGEVVDLITFCGATGPAWADRRTTIDSESGARIEAASLWVALGPGGRPARLSPEFVAVYGTAAARRRVSGRLKHSSPPPPVGFGVHTRPWPLRSTDHEGMGHVNNAATWEPVEDELDRRRLVPVRAVVEYPGAISPGATVELCSLLDDDLLRMWLIVEGVVRASVEVLTTKRRPLPVDRAATPR